MFPLAALLLCSNGLSQNMPTSPKPDPAHIGPLAPDPRIKQHQRKEQPKLSESELKIEAEAEKAKRIPAVKHVVVQPAVADVYFREVDNTIEIVNGTGTRIVGLSILIHPGAHMVIDGLTTLFEGIPPGGSMPVGITGFGDIHMPEAQEKYGQSYSLDWALFEDGQFYGSEKDAAELAARARARGKFLSEISLKPRIARDLYVDEAIACTNDPKCMGKFGSTAAEIMAVRRAAQSYRDYAARFQDTAEQFLKAFTAKHATYPRVRHVARATKIIAPEDKTNGWSFGFFRASCKNSPGYSTVSPGVGCEFNTIPSGEPPLRAGFVASSNASCYNQYTRTRTKDIRSEFDHAVVTSSTGPNGQQYLPKHLAHTRVETNYNQQLFEGWTGDTTYFAVAYGYPEPMGQFANVNGGKTWCSLFFDGPPYGPYANNTVDGYPRPGNTLGTVLLFDYNTTNQAIANGYGFFVANYEESKICGDPDVLVTPFEQRVMIPGSIWSPTLPIVKNDGAHGLGVSIGCYHEGNKTANNEGSCNPVTDFCCCMATYEDFGLCEEAYGLVPPLNGCGGPAVVAIHTSTGTAMVESAIGLSGSKGRTKMGISRAGGSWLLDSTGENSYVAGETTFFQAFIPPGGLQSADVPVSGDWDGTGSTKIGLFRPSTGAWYLDANNNGTWDGVAGGDLQYQFGGGIAPFGAPNTTGYVPGDVPIVGDWQGTGKDCIGVFRFGYFWITDSNCSGTYETGDNAFSFGGILGDVPVVGKWGGYSNSQAGVVRCYIDPATNVCSGAPFFWVLDAFPANGAYHSIGQGSSCGLPNPQYQAQCLTPAPFVFGGLPGDIYLAGDWLGNGNSYPGVYRAGAWIEGQDGVGSTYAVYNFGGVPGDRPLVGKW